MYQLPSRAGWGIAHVGESRNFNPKASHILNFIYANKNGFRTEAISH
jgi:hypothetical protein